MVRLPTEEPMILKLIWQIVLTIIRWTLSAGLIVHLWRWFVMPLDVPAIGYAQAFGLDVLVSYLTIGYGDASLMWRDTNDKLHAPSWDTIICVGWFVGYLAHVAMRFGG